MTIRSIVVSQRFAGSRAKRAVIALLLSLGTAAAFADAHPVATPGRTTPPLQQYVVGSATNGTDFLLLWRDIRTATDTLHASHLDANGTASTDVILNQEAATPSGLMNGSLTVLWTGRIYLTLFRSNSQQQVMEARFQPDGRLLDISALPFGSVDTGASNGTRSLVVVSRYDPTLNIGVRSVLVFDADGEQVHSPIEYAKVPQPWLIVSNGKGFLCLTSTSTSGGAFTEAYGPISADGIVGPLNPTPSAWLSSNGNDYLLSDTTTRPFTYLRLDDAGNTLSHVFAMDATPMAIPLKFRGSSYLVTGVDASYLLHCWQLDGAGREIAELPLSLPATYGNHLNAISNDTATLLIRSDYFHVFKSTLGGAGEELLLTGPPLQDAPSVAAGPNGWLTVWNEQRNSLWETRAARLDVNGFPLDGEGLLLGDHYANEPTAVAFDGEHYVVVWGSSCTVHMARIATDGTILDTRILLSDCASTLALAPAPDRVLLTWWTRSDLPSPIKAAIIDRSGNLGSIHILPDQGAAHLQAAWSGQVWLVAWDRAIDSFATRLATDGTPLDNIRLPVGNDFFLYESVSSVAANSGGFLVGMTVTDPNKPSAPPLIVVRRISNSGTLGESIIFENGSRPSAIWNGNDYLLAWEDGGVLYTKPLTSGSRQLLAPSTDPQSWVRLTSSAGTVAATFLRTATQWPYLGTPTVYFLRTASHPRATAHL